MGEKHLECQSFFSVRILLGDQKETNQKPNNYKEHKIIFYITDSL